MFQTVIFDLDGTLLDTLQDLASAGNHTLSVLGLPEHSPVSYRKMVGNGIPKLVQRMLPENNRGEATQLLAQKIFQDYYAKHMFDLTAPYSGILSLLDTLKEKGIVMGVLSNKEDLFVQEIIIRYFPNIFTSLIGKRPEFPVKPDPSSLNILLERLNSTKAQTLYCGDSNVDIYTAQNAGLQSCGVLWGFRDREELLAAGANFLVQNTLELAAIILE